MSGFTQIPAVCLKAQSGAAMKKNLYDEEKLPYPLTGYVSPLCQLANHSPPPATQTCTMHMYKFSPPVGLLQP